MLVNCIVKRSVSRKNILKLNCVLYVKYSKLIKMQMALVVGNVRNNTHSHTHSLTHTLTHAHFNVNPEVRNYISLQFGKNTGLCLSVPYPALGGEPISIQLCRQPD